MKLTLEESYLLFEAMNYLNIHSFKQNEEKYRALYNKIVDDEEELNEYEIAFVAKIINDYKEKYFLPKIASADEILNKLKKKE